MLCLVSLVTLAVLLTGTSASDGCCMPNRLQGSMGSITGYHRNRGHHGHGGLAMGSEWFAYEYDGGEKDQGSGKVAACFQAYVSEENKSYKGRFIQRFDMKKQYYVVGEKCKVMDLKREMDKPCLKSSKGLAVREVGTANMGPEDSPLHTITYEAKVSKPRMMSYISLTDGCLPVGETAFGEYKGVGFVETVGYSNLTQTLTPDAFDVPKSCEKVNGTMAFPQMPFDQFALLNLF